MSRARGHIREDASIKFKFKYLEQAVFNNHHFMVIILVGFFGLVFTPIETSFQWINESIDFINSLMLGVGLSGIICWVFAFKIKGEVSRTVWNLCYVLLNLCHIICVLFFLFFFIMVGVRLNGAVSALACGVFSSLILGVMLSMKYGYRGF